MTRKLKAPIAGARPRGPRGRLAPAARQAGSGYLVALLAMVILTIVGLSLAFITQTELQIGGNERTTTRVFYAADAGVEVAIARAVVTADHSAQSFTLSDKGDDLTAGLGFASEIEVSPFYPILDTPCNLCEINNAGTYREQSYRKINNAVTSTAQRFGTVDAGDNRRLLAQRSISSMVEIQPWKVTPQAYFPIDQPDLLDKIKF